MVQNVSCLAFLYRPVLTDGLTLGKRRENGEQEEVTFFPPPRLTLTAARKASIGKEVTTCFFLTLTATRRPEICLAHFCRFCGSLDVTGQPCRQVSKRGTIWLVWLWIQRTVFLMLSSHHFFVSLPTHLLPVVIVGLCELTMTTSAKLLAAFVLPRTSCLL